MEKKVYTLKINEELETVMPPLQGTVLSLLTQSLRDEGCRDPLVVWKETGELIDGHERYRICKKYNIPFTYIEASFESIGEAKVWMILNQIGRRKLTDFQLCALARLYEFETAEV